MSDPTEVTIARLRWRADLCEASAVDLAPTDLPAAAEKQLAANLLDQEADGIEALLAAKRSGDPAAIEAASIALRSLRKTWREMGESTGTRAAGVPLNNFTEPSDAELIGA